MSKNKVDITSFFKKMPAAKDKENPAQDPSQAADHRPPLAPLQQVSRVEGRWCVFLRLG